MDVLEENPREESDPDLEVKWDIRLLEDRYNHWKDIVEENIYQVHSAKHFTGFFSDFAGNSCAQKPNKAKTKQENIIGIKYFRGLWSYARINQSAVNFVLSSFFSLCTNSL